MPKFTSLDDLRRFRDELAEKRKQEAARGLKHITVGTGSCGIAAGALDVLRAVEDELKLQKASNVVVTETGCLGLCSHEPMLEVEFGGSPKVAYGKVDPESAKRIVREHVLAGTVVTELVIDETPFPTI